MTAQELIDHLRSLPPEAPVVQLSMEDSGQYWYESSEHPPRLEKMRRVEKEERRKDDFLGAYLDPSPYGYQPEKMSEPLTVIVL